MDIFFAFFMALISIGFVSAMAVIAFGAPGPIGLFTSCVSNKEFKQLIEMILEHPNMKHDRFNIEVPGYKIWIANGLYGFSINDIKAFSAYQKLWFRGRWKSYLRMKHGSKKDLQRQILKIHTVTPAGQVLYGSKK